MLAPLAFFLVDGNWVQLGGIVMAFLGCAAANARFSPVHGCLVWLPMIGIAVFASLWPGVAIPWAIPLIAWAALAWLAGCVECRLTLVPFEGSDSAATPVESDAGPREPMT